MSSSSTNLDVSFTDDAVATSIHFGSDSETTHESEITSSITNFSILEPRMRYAVYKIKIIVAKIQDKNNCGNNINNNINNTMNDDTISSNNKSIKEWIIHKRYSDFVLLNKKLQRRFPLVSLALPPKRYVGNNFNDEFISKRRDGLEDYIKQLFSFKQLCSFDAVRKFFMLDNPPFLSKDLENCDRYVVGLEHKVEELESLAHTQRMEIQWLKDELHKISMEKAVTEEEQNNKIDSLLITKNHLDELLSATNNRLEEKEETIESLKEELRYSTEIRHKERQMLREQIQSLQQTYINNKYHAQQTLKDVGTTVANTGDSDSEPTNNNKTKEVNSLVVGTIDDLEQLAKAQISLYQAQLEEEKIVRRKLETHLKNCQQETISMYPKLKQLEEEISKEHVSLHYHEQTVNSHIRTIRTLEQKYFYALVLGVKLNELNTSLYSDSEVLWKHGTFEPGKLFLKVKEAGVGVEGWPGWVGNELKLCLDEARKASK